MERGLPPCCGPHSWSRFGLFLRLRLGRHVLRRRRSDDATRDAASRHTTTNYQLASPSSVHKGGTQPGCQGLHHARSTCITRASPASRWITCIRPASPASTLHHLHQPCITCINPASRAKGCINPASAAHGLHHAHQGTRKTQAPSTKHASNAKPPLRPLPAAPLKSDSPRAAPVASRSARVRAPARGVRAPRRRAGGAKERRARGATDGTRDKAR